MKAKPRTRSHEPVYTVMMLASVRLQQRQRRRLVDLRVTRAYELFSPYSLVHCLHRPSVFIRICFRFAQVRIKTDPRYDYSLNSVIARDTTAWLWWGLYPWVKKNLDRFIVLEIMLVWQRQQEQARQIFWCWHNLLKQLVAWKGLEQAVALGIWRVRVFGLGRVKWGCRVKCLNSNKKINYIIC